MFATYSKIYILSLSSSNTVSDIKLRFMLDISLFIEEI